MTPRRPGGARVLPALVLALAALVGGATLAAVAGGGERSDAGPTRDVAIGIHYSAFAPGEVRVPIGVPVTFTIRNDDPIDHEWIVGDEQVHAYHRTSTEVVHGDRPTEIPLPPLETRTTTITFDQPGRFRFICHLPGHEAYGMVGVVTVEG